MEHKEITTEEAAEKNRQTKIASMLGLARKAGQVILGNGPISDCLGKGVWPQKRVTAKAVTKKKTAEVKEDSTVSSCLLLFSSDAAKNTTSRLIPQCERNKIPYETLPLDSAALGACVGKHGKLTSALVIDRNFVAGIYRLLNQ